MHRICRTKAFVSAPFGKRVDCVGRGATPGVVVAATLFISQLSVRSDGVHLRKARLVVSFFPPPFFIFFLFFFVHSMLRAQSSFRQMPRGFASTIKRRLASAEKREKRGDRN